MVIIFAQCDCTYRSFLNFLREGGGGREGEVTMLPVIRCDISFVACH